MAILLATNFPPDALGRLRQQCLAEMPDEQVVALGEHYAPEAIDVALVANPPAGALQGLPRLGFIQSMWAGVDRLVADAAVPPDVPLARMVDPAMNASMAETALWAVLGLHRGGFDYAHHQRQAAWKPQPQRRADEVHVAVLGLGEMGRTTALRLVANGYRVSGWSTRDTTLAGVSTLHGDAALDTLLQQAEIVINLLPLTARTQGLFNARTFACMRPSSSLVNFARGAHVVDADLLAALDSGHLRRAVLDVFHTEPLPADHAYWSHRQVTVLPHVAAQTDVRSATRFAMENVRAWRAGRTPAHLLDRQRGY